MLFSSARFWNDFSLLYEACFPPIVVGTGTTMDDHHPPHHHHRPPPVHHPAHRNLLELRRLLTKYSYRDDDDDDDDGVHRPHYAYGTAGFRYPHAELPAVLLRVGVAAALLTAGGDDDGGGGDGCHDVGVMVTASHNAEDYNGVKLAGADGGMIGAQAEALTVRVVNERHLGTLLGLVEARLARRQEQEQRGGSSRPPPPVVVHLGRDTREHSPHLAGLVRRGAVLAGCAVLDHGVVTTPMLHHCVRHANAAAGRIKLPLAIPVRLNGDGYCELLVQSYATLLATQPQQQHNGQQPSRQQKRRLTVDCACGVGYPHLREIVRRLARSASGSNSTATIIRATNPPGAGPLNEGCGSEYVQKEQTPCKWYSVGGGSSDDDDDDDDDLGNNDNNEFAGDMDTSYCAALDGDADRIVFFSCNNNNSDDSNDSGFTLLDGDQMACLIGNFLRDQLQTVLQQINNDSDSELPLKAPKLGVVQTAYANGASTEYLKQQGVEVAIAKTGVKYVHQMAHDLFDIGVYFEANGHGTVLFGSAYYDFLAAADRRVATHTPAAVALQRLRVLPSLINQAVGDALSDLLLVDAILQLQHWTLAQWSAALYRDLPSRQLKVRVADRTVVQTNDNETRCVAPAAVQTELEAAVAQCDRGRAFVRPSGTEDVVRVYAEAATAEQADALAARAAEIVFRLCGGVGEAPPSSSQSKL